MRQPEVFTSRSFQLGPDRSTHGPFRCGACYGILPACFRRAFPVGAWCVFPAGRRSALRCARPVVRFFSEGWDVALRCGATFPAGAGRDKAAPAPELFHQRQLNCKGGAFSRCGRDVYCAAMLCNDRFYDEKAHSVAVFLGFVSKKPVEYPWQILP